MQSFGANLSVIDTSQNDTDALIEEEGKQHLTILNMWSLPK